MDLEMSAGKIASQAGHAYLGAFLKSTKEAQAEYMKDCIGTKVCLQCPDLGTLHRYHLMAQELGLPTDFIVDTGNNGWDGVPTATALGIGPINRTQARFLRKLKLLK
jgi:peptidyl-tRNA hydrolase